MHECRSGQLQAGRQHKGQCVPGLRDRLNTRQLQVVRRAQCGVFHIWVCNCAWLVLLCMHCCACAAPCCWLSLGCSSHPHTQKAARTCRMCGVCTAPAHMTTSPPGASSAVSRVPATKRMATGHFDADAEKAQVKRRGQGTGTLHVRKAASCAVCPCINQHNPPAGPSSENLKPSSIRGATLSQSLIS